MLSDDDLKWLETPAIFQDTKPKERLVTVRLVAEPEPEAKANPQIFVPVDPNVATEEAPKQTENYSNANSLAANPETGNTDTPNIEGKQKIERRAHTDDTSAASQQLAAKPAPAKPQSARPVVAPVIVPKKPAPKRPTPPAIVQSGESGALAPLRPFNPPNFSSTVPVPTPKINERRPPNLAEAQAQLGKGTLAGRPSPFEGGVQRNGPHALDVRLTGFGDYDARFIATIKASLVGAIFMHLSHEKKTIYVLIVIGILMGISLMGLTGWAFQDPIEYGNSVEGDGFFNPEETVKQH